MQASCYMLQIPSTLVASSDLACIRNFPPCLRVSTRLPTLQPIQNTPSFRWSKAELESLLSRICLSLSLRLSVMCIALAPFVRLCETQQMSHQKFFYIEPATSGRSFHSISILPAYQLTQTIGMFRTQSHSPTGTVRRLFVYPLLASKLFSPDISQRLT